MRTALVCSLAASLSLGASGASRASDSVVHLQPDRPEYRLGETLWYRAHTDSRSPLEVRWIGPHGELLASSAFDAVDERPSAGSFFVSPELEGGTFRLQARAGDRLAHEVSVDVYDSLLPELDLGLEILGDVHYPGEEIVASFRARDLAGRPLAGARVEYLATFGKLRVRDTAGVTDAGGRRILRVPVPRGARERGHLAVGVEVGRHAAAIARPIALSASVASVEWFPEGGAIVAGHPQRVAFLVRDLDGLPATAEGRILDDADRCVASFRADSRGIGSVVLAYDSRRSYRAVVDRPADVEPSFALPEPTGHVLSLLVEPIAGGFHGFVRAARDLAGQDLLVHLEANGESTLRVPIRLGTPRDDGRRRPPAVEGGGDAADRLPIAEFTVSRPDAGGLGHLVVIRGDRAMIKRPLFLGPPQRVDVEVLPLAGQSLVVGRVAEFEVRTTRHRVPVSADIALSMYRGGGELEDYATRRAFEAHFASAGRVPNDFLVESPDAYTRRDDCLLVHASFAYPIDGIEVGDDDLPPADAAVRVVDSIPPRAGTASIELAGGRSSTNDDSASGESSSAHRRDERRGRTVVRSNGLERLLERAPFTRSARAAVRHDSTALDVPETALLALPGLGKEQKSPPQAQRVPSSRLDTRQGLFWSERIRTDAGGRTTIRAPLGDLVSPIAWCAQGSGVDLDGRTPMVASGRGSVAPDAGFRTQVETPEHLHVGDVFDLMLSTVVTDGGNHPIDIDLRPPSCLEPLLRTRLRYDPKVHTDLHRFRFRVTAPADRAELRIVAQRGRYRAIHARSLEVLEREVEKRVGRAGRTRGTELCTFPIPATARADSVRVEASVSSGYVARARAFYRDNLQEPTGCFEQYTSQNYANLLTLDALQKLDSDPELLEQAYDLSRRGFETILSYRDPATGAFRLYAGDPPSVRSTVIGLCHLALYERLFGGLGRPEFESSLHWLESQDTKSRLEALHLTASLHENDRSWRGARAACFAETKDINERALQAYCLASWPRNAAETEEERAARAKRTTVLVDSVRDALRRDEASYASLGEGLMGDRGGQLAVSVRSLLALTLAALEREDEARELLADVADAWHHHGGTFGSFFALKAFARLLRPLGDDLVKVEFASKPGGREQHTTLSGSTRPLRFERAIAVKPGERVDVRVDVESELAQEFDVRCSYLVEMPRPSPSAPVRIATRIDPVVDIGRLANVLVTLSPVPAFVSDESTSQVVARVGLPGGCIVPASELTRLRAAMQGDGHCEVRDGYLDLYFTKPLGEARSLRFAVRAAIAGDFRARPSVAFPYYESGRESYAEPLALKVVNTFGNDAAPDDVRAAQLRRLRR